MKHADAGSLEALSDLLESLRTRTALVERRPGIFYLRGKPFLHFHEDPAGIFADLRLSRDWQRMPVNSSEQRTELLAVIDQTRYRCLTDEPPRSGAGNPKIPFSHAGG